MHRRPPHKHHGGLWEFPGGKVEDGESPGRALVRELHEELGISLETDSIRPLAFAQERRGDSAETIVILLYKVDAWRGEPHACESGAAIEWFTPEQVGTLERPPLDEDLCARIFPTASDNGGVG